ncbi:MAG: hypothetical protein AMJ60_11695 [Desulfobacterales bacterium SG8_35]|nr:MAG: hypothetical protein AMJ60_11695 [Desulfobacterales bacterium SG8_35]
MTKPAEKLILQFTGYKTIVALGICIALSLAILTFTDWLATPNRTNPYFSYGASGNSDEIVHVIDDKRVEVPIFFDIGQGIEEVSLSFSGEHSQMTGLEISDKTVTVVNGKAVSLVIIQFTSKTALKAGTHYLTVMASDTATGKIIRKGDIHFTYNMHELIGKCSC